MSFTMPKQTSGSGGAPPGNYRLEFVGEDEVPANLEKGWKEAVKFTFRVVSDGEHKDKLAWRTCSKTFHKTKSELPRFLTMMGVDYASGVANTDACKGKVYHGVVALSPTGKPRVENLVPVQ